MLFVFLVLTSIIHTFNAQSDASNSTLGGGPSGHYGVQIIIYNEICEEMVYSGFSVSPFYQDCNPNQQETWDDPESIGPKGHGYIVYQGHANVGVAGVVQWNIAGDTDKSVIVYYRASNGWLKGENKVSVVGGSIHFESTADMMDHWFSDCEPVMNDERCGNPCWAEGLCRPECADNSIAVGKETWDLSDIENTNYFVEGYIEGGNNPYLYIYVLEKLSPINPGGSTACDYGMNCPVV